MKEFSADVLVVGAGPGGIKAAMQAKEDGAEKVLLIDRKQEIGAPVRCGEGLSKGWMDKLGVKVNKSFCMQRVEGALLFSPSGKMVEAKSNQTGYILDRKVFEKEIAKEACRKGVQLEVKTFAKEVIMKNGFVKGVTGLRYGEKFRVASEITIAADGVDSGIGRKAGINTTLPITELDSGFEYEMIDIDVLDPTMMELYFGNDVAPRGYVWIFPKGKDTANVGVGITPTAEQNAKWYLDKFIEENKERFANASILEAKAGAVPVGGFDVKKYGNGIMLVGDAARQVNPLHGGGMGIAMEAGILAGTRAAEALENEDGSEDFLKAYEDQWWEKQGGYLHKSLKVRRVFEKMTDKQFEIMADVFGGNDIYGLLFGTGLLKAGMKLLKNDPKLAKSLMSIARG